jgi:transposase
VNTISEQIADGRRRRRLHSDEFKANVVAACMHPGMSMAAVAMANGINANLLRRWVRAAEMSIDSELPRALPTPKRPATGTSAAFVPIQLPAKAQAADIHIELHRGATSITVSWPTDAATE